MFRFLFASLLTLSFAAAPLGAETLTVSAAVSLKEALTEAAHQWHTDAVAEVKLNFGATGQLLAQIREGAPVDIFIAAADEQMDQAIAMKLVDPATRTTFAGNQLVLIVPPDSKLEIKSFQELRDASVKRLAIGQRRTVPAGMYAVQVLEKRGLAESMKDRLVLGGSVRQVLDYVERGEVEAGVVYATDAKQSGAKVRVIATADPSWHSPIRYSAAIVAQSAHQDAAKKFIDHLLSPPAQSTFAAHGFAPPATQPARQD